MRVIMGDPRLRGDDNWVGNVPCNTAHKARLERGGDFPPLGENYKNEKDTMKVSFFRAGKGFVANQSPLRG